MPRRGQIKRVTFIGASAWAGYPLGASLIPRLADYINGAFVPRRDKRRLYNSLRSSRADRKEAQALADDLYTFVSTYFTVGAANTLFRKGNAADNGACIDVNQFYSIADVLSEMPDLLGGNVRTQTGRGEANLSNLYPRLAAATRTYFNDVFNASSNFPKDLNSIVQGADCERHAFVNFNWDELIDYKFTLGDHDLFYTYESWKASRGSEDFLLLKPHGSVCWYDTVQGLDSRDMYYVAQDDPRIPRERRRLISYYDADQPTAIGGETHPLLSCPPVITPPTYGKRFNYLEQQCIWQDVINVCREADEFVFLGYRIGRDDYLTRAAIRRARKAADAPIHVLAVLPWQPAPPDGAAPAADEVMDAFQDVFGPSFQQEHVLDWRLGETSSGRKSLAMRIEQRLAAAKIDPRQIPIARDHSTV
jgi:hypothetical protein